ncbi:hypothetical protein Tco_1196362 [Tanacetum coccineum]
MMKKWCVGTGLDEKEVSNADPVTIAGEVVTTANTQDKRGCYKEPSKSIITTTTTTTTTIPSKDQGKGIMVEEPLKMKKKDQISFDEQEAIRLQAEFDEEDKVETNYELAQRLQAGEQEELTIEEKSKLVNTFVDMDTELMEDSETREESSSKRAGNKLEQEPSKKQKVDDDKETEELKQCMEIISDDGDDVTIEATPLSTKSPTIVDYKINKEGKKSYF